MKHSRRISRWRQRLGGALILCLALLGTVQAQGPTQIVFSFGPDDSGSLQALIDRFNQEYQGEIEVTWREMPRSTDEYLRQLQSDFLADASDIDVIGADVVWTAELVYNNQVRDLTGRFNSAFNRENFVEAALDSATYRNRIWGVPWFTDAGLLYYRADLLEQNGFSEPPATWDELSEMANQITQNSDTQYGFVFQGATYEGGVANALEYIWGARGRVLTGNISTAGTFGQNVTSPNVINIDGTGAAQGLNAARSLVEDGVAPQEVTDFREEDAYEAFLAGDAVFMRNWPFVYGLIEDSNLSLEQVGVAQLPVVSEGNPTFATLGGWNLMISADSDNVDAAWTFIQFATDPEQQKLRALEGGFLPTLQPLYEDQEITEQVPVVSLGRDAVENARVRPVTPFYSAMSQRIAQTFTRVLRGEVDGQEAVSNLQRELQTILRKSR